MSELFTVTAETGRPWYRVVLPARSVWAETSDLVDAQHRLHEVVQQGGVLQRCFMVHGTTPWEDFDPAENPR